MILPPNFKFSPPGGVLNNLTFSVIFFAVVHVKKATLEKTANASTSPATRRRVKMAGSVDSEINTHTHAIVSPVSNLFHFFSARPAGHSQHLNINGRMALKIHNIYNLHERTGR